MSEHQELLNVMLDADEAHKAEGAMWPELATAILAAGYRKPRQVTTVEELDALPEGVVLREDAHGLIWERQGNGEGGSFWVETGDEQEYKTSDIDLPATVLHIGATND